MTQERPHPEAVPSTEVSLPRINPMFPAEATRLPADIDKWIVEIKFEGLRAIAYLSPESIAIRTRSGRNVARSFPQITASLARKARTHTAILDGELIYGEGKTPQGRNMVSGRAGSSPKPIGPEESFKFVAFDILYQDGQRLTHLPLIERKRRLEHLLTPYFRRRHPQVALGPYAEGKKRLRILDIAQTQGFEGIVLKAQDSLYQPGTHNSWLKIKFIRRA